MELLTAYSMHSRMVNALACACWAGLSVLAVLPCVFFVSGVVRVAVSVLVVRPSGVIPCARTCPEAVVAAEINVKTIIGIIGFIIRCCFP